MEKMPNFGDGQKKPVFAGHLILIQSISQDPLAVLNRFAGTS